MKRTPAEKEKYVQSLKALLIPLALFIATLDLAGGMFLIYNSYSIGFAFVIIGITAIIIALVAFIKYQQPPRTPGPPHY